MDAAVKPVIPMRETGVSRFNRISPVWNVIFTTVLCVVSLAMVLPIVLVAIVSFSSEASVANAGYSFFPIEWSLQAYNHLGKMGSQVMDSFVITVFYTIAGTVMSLSVMSMFAFVIAQKRFVARRFFTWLLFFTMLFSGGLVPGYILNTRYLKINNTIWVFLLPGIINAYNVIILRTFIMTTIPDSLFEAARIDGAGHFTVFVRITLPLFKAGLATIGLFNVVNRWNDWFIGMLYIINPKLVPLQTMLQKMQMSIEFLKSNSGIAGTPDGVALLKQLPDQNLRMACTLIIVLPMLVTYPFFQRYFVHGLTLGGIKE
ncbi:MAG: carbohydrate ABC transporter permease [Oscillospiraceae bacterium]|jgi:putative aldouronate transport system permease protein|nr:carbohydrate ABC transporter permease [Oscillospiraceae bacterium]